ncbi:MAG: hypothetical protein K2H83_02530 [Duncaniella sp.]|nr:hypothetical protein [Duncaniella sp.]
MIIIYILLGLVALGIAIFLLKILAMLCGLAIVLGGITWLIFDSFWIGCIIGGLITLVIILRSPREYFEDLFDEAASSSSSSSGGSSSNSSGERVRDKYGNWRQVTYKDSTTMWDDYGHKYTKDSDGNWRCD